MSWTIIIYILYRTKVWERWDYKSILVSGSHNFVSIRAGFCTMRDSWLGISKCIENFSRHFSFACLYLFYCLCMPQPLLLPQQLFTNLKYTFLPLFLHPQQCVSFYIASFLSFVLYTTCFWVSQGIYILFYIVFLFVDFEKLCQDHFFSFILLSLFLVVCMS